MCGEPLIYRIKQGFVFGGLKGKAFRIIGNDSLWHAAQFPEHIFQSCKRGRYIACPYKTHHHIPRMPHYSNEHPQGTLLSSLRIDYIAEFAPVNYERISWGIDDFLYECFPGTFTNVCQFVTVQKPVKT